MERQELYRLISLPPEMIERLQEVEAATDLEGIEDTLRQMMDAKTAAAAYKSLESRLGEDEGHMAMLYCQLECARRIYGQYKEKGISQAVYVDTMKCFSRFIGECNKKNGWMFFDRGWWTYRQVSMSLFRIGTLEFELDKSGKEKAVAVHIPSDADLSERAVDSSLEQAGSFFRRYYPDYQYDKYICDSWLLSPVLQELLPRQSNIVRFQERFVITGRNEDEKEYIEWLFQVPVNTAYRKLPESTALQRKAKELLLAGGNIGTAYGFMEASGSIGSCSQRKE